ncbi:hypothetical protein [Streptomyces sp. NPDC090026]|uniref:hypothetical protein n=1 Tax=Streptomyces sp. NPDC090026 TaxID=3365923 RepID=UPI00382B9912
MEQTYDPILSSEELPRWRVTNRLRPPGPGRALVLVGDSGPSLTIHSGEEIPFSRLSAYRSVMTVDLTEHQLTLGIPLLSRDPASYFRSRVDLLCRVADPAEVVSRGIRDVSEALCGHLRTTLRNVARDYDIADFYEAERALNAALADFTGDDMVRLRIIRIELLVGEDEVAARRKFRDVAQEAQLLERADVIRAEGADRLIAELMEQEGPRGALAWAKKYELRREVMRLILERGDAEHVRGEAAYRAVLSALKASREGQEATDGTESSATRNAVDEEVAAASENLEHTLARLFVRLGPPPEPSGLGSGPSGSGGGGEQR